MDASTLKTVALVLFALTYISLLVFAKYRAYIAAAVGVIFVALGIMPIGNVLGAINWNVLMMIGGTMGTVALFIESRMPARMADKIIDKVPNVKWAIIALSFFAGIISAFVDNVATVLMVAPVAISIAKKLKISPVPSILAIAIASNLQGAATLVGDTTSILLAGAADMNFMDFFIFKGKMGMFWIVQIAALASTLFLVWYFRKEKAPIHMEGAEKVHDYFPTFLLIGTVVVLIIASFIPASKKPETINGLICVGFYLIGVVRNLLKKRMDSIKDSLKEIDFFTILLLAGLFVVIGGISQVGVIEDISDLFIKISNNNVFILYSLLVWASVLLSAFIDNIPYIATMIPVVTVMSQAMGIEPYVLYFGLLSGATLGGNLTPIGASANIAGIGILRKEGHEVKASTFMKMSVPFTLIAAFVGYVLVWVIWK